ncbi:hypothetical protein BpHYR1_017904 [Brachionus plicatilis]|uniref:Uncharacterized protein n=1 Tax=Brachionus plicatilis TaxID=10195 RepID=A0A3M7SX81_BRAPC|nr:hypothetical protein BpHYR1_017904 [Brachionus plicatilis]
MVQKFILICYKSGQDLSQFFSNLNQADPSFKNYIIKFALARAIWTQRLYKTMPRLFALGSISYIVMEFNTLTGVILACLAISIQLHAANIYTSTHKSSSGSFATYIGSNRSLKNPSLKCMRCFSPLLFIGTTPGSTTTTTPTIK